MATATAAKFNELEGKDITAVQLNRLSTAINTPGVEPDKAWFSKTGTLYQTLERREKPKNIGESILKYLAPTLQIGSALFRGDLVGAFSGVIATVATDGIASITKWGIDNYAVFKAGGIAALSGLGAVAVSFLTGTSPLQIMRGLLNFTDTVYDFNFDTPDSSIWQQIKSTIDSLYGQAGDFLGSSFARLLLIGTLSPPKIEIDINGISLALSEFSEERRDDLLNGVSSFAWMGIRAVQRITFLFAFLNGRKAIRDLANSSPAFRQMLDKGFPGLGKALQGWGDEENPLTKEEEVKDWKISTFVENKLENVKKTYGEQIGNFVEQFFEGFTDELRDGLEEYIEYRFV